MIREEDRAAYQYIKVFTLYSPIKPLAIVGPLVRQQLF